MSQHHPSRSPEDLIEGLEKQYLLAVMALGGAAGAVAAVPGGGAVVALPLNILEIGGYLEATTLFVLAVAEVHGVQVSDVDRRRALVLAVILGDGGAKAVQKIAGRVGPHWARLIVNGIPIRGIRAVNKVLGHNFVTKFGTKQGVLVLGRELPLGIGALIGAGGNLTFGYLSVRAARSIFGPPPSAPADPATGTLHPADRMTDTTAPASWASA